MNQQKAARKETEEDEESDDEFEMIKASPSKKRQPAVSSPPLVPLRKNARKSIAVSRADEDEEEEEEEPAPVPATTRARKVVVQVSR